MLIPFVISDGGLTVGYGKCTTGGPLAARVSYERNKQMQRHVSWAMLCGE